MFSITKISELFFYLSTKKIRLLFVFTIPILFNFIYNIYDQKNINYIEKFNMFDLISTSLLFLFLYVVGNEIKNWLESLLPVKEIEMAGFGTCAMTTLEGEGIDDMFGIDNYGVSLQPPMTVELEEKISRSVNDAYNAHTKQ